MFGRRKRERLPPNRDAVVDRVLCVSVVAMLGAIVTGVAEGAMDDASAEACVAESHRWLRREQLADALTIGERHLIAKSLADWSERESVAAGWRSESAGVLLWALSAFAEHAALRAALREPPVARAAPGADGRLPEQRRVCDSPEVIRRRARTLSPSSVTVSPSAGENGCTIACSSATARSTGCAATSPTWDKRTQRRALASGTPSSRWERSQMIARDVRGPPRRGKPNVPWSCTSRRRAQERARAPRGRSPCRG